MISCENGYSMAMWLKPAETIPVGIVLSSGGNTNKVNPSGVALKFEPNGVLAFNARVRFARKRWLIRHDLSRAEWMHVALTWKQDGNMTAYVNGSFVEADPGKTYDPSSILQTTNMAIGSHMDGSQNYGHFVLDELYVWDQELSATEVAQVYNSHTG